MKRMSEEKKSRERNRAILKLKLCQSNVSWYQYNITLSCYQIQWYFILFNNLIKIVSLRIFQKHFKYKGKQMKTEHPLINSFLGNTIDMYQCCHLSDKKIHTFAFSLLCKKA